MHAQTHSPKPTPTLLTDGPWAVPQRKPGFPKTDLDPGPVPVLGSEVCQA